MEHRDLHWFDGKVLEEKLGDVVDRLQILVTKSDQNSDALVKLKALKMKAGDDRSFGLLVKDGVLKKYDKAYKAYSAGIPEEMSDLWYRVIANFRSLISSLSLAYSLGPRLKQVILLLDEVRAISTELDIVADGLRKAYAEFWQHWFTDVYKSYQVANAWELFQKRHNLKRYVMVLLVLPAQLSEVMNFATESKSPLIITGTKKFAERLAEIKLHELQEDVFRLTSDFFLCLSAFKGLNEEIKEIPLTVPSHGSLGSGAFGKVVVAEYKGQLVAKKLVKSNANGLCNFVIELATWKEVSTKNPSPHILKLVGSGIDPETQKFVFLSEIAKCTLESMLEDQVQKEPEFIKSVATDIARGLEHMHSLDYLHLDIKSDNVLMFTDELSPVGYRAKLGDFGISRKAPVDFAGGCLLYMPVEARLYGHFDFSNDIYAFGLVLYQLLEPKSFERCAQQGSAAFLTPVPFSWHTSARARAIVRKCIGPYTQRPTAKTLVKKIPKLWLKKYMSSVVPTMPKLFKRDGEDSPQGGFFPKVGPERFFRREFLSVEGPFKFGESTTLFPPEIQVKPGESTTVIPPEIQGKPGESTTVIPPEIQVKPASRWSRGTKSQRKHLRIGRRSEIEEQSSVIPPETQAKPASRWSRGIKAKHKLLGRRRQFKNREQALVMPFVEPEIPMTTWPHANTGLDATAKFGDDTVDIEASKRVVEERKKSWVEYGEEDKGEEEEGRGQVLNEPAHKKGTLQIMYDSFINAFKNIFGESMISASPGQSPEKHATVAAVPNLAPPAKVL